MNKIKILYGAAALCYLAAVVTMALEAKTAAYVLFILGSVSLVAGRSAAKRSAEKKTSEEE